MPFEVMVVVVVAIIAGTISSIAKHVFAVGKVAAQKTGEGSSLTTSELAKMVRAAVEEGTARLEDRFDAVERRLDRLEARSSTPLLPPLDEPLDPFASEEERAAVRRARTS